MVWVLAKCVPMTIHRNDLDELKDLGDRIWSLRVTLALCPTQGDNMRMRAEHRYGFPGDSACLWGNGGLDSHPHLLEDSLPLQYSKSRFPQLVSLNGREAHNPKHSLPVYPQRLCNLASLHGHTFLNLGRESKTRLPMWAPNALRNPRYKVRLLRG